MAFTTCSASYSSIPSPTWSYDVFVSFSGKDTRFNFTDHLFAALYRSGIRAFRDDKTLERGKDIWTELEKAIEMSRIAVIVFSRNYAASEWCLDELVKIMECKRSLQQIVLPIFYDVPPSQVRTLKANFSDDVEDFGEDKLQRWRASLTEAANLAGWDLQNVAHRFESKCIEEIIEDILVKLNLAYFSVTPYPVGIESQVQEVNEYLDTNSDNFSVLLPGVPFPHWFDFESTGSILSFVVPPLANQKIRGWFLCAVFVSRFHDIHGFTIICQFKNNTKGTHWHDQQKNCQVIPCQEHLWMHSVPLHHITHLLEAGDEVEYSIHVSGGFQLKKFGVQLIYENDKQDYQSYFEEMIQNASLPYTDDFLHEDVSKDQAMAGDKKILGVHKYHKGLASEGNVRYDWSSFHEYQQKTMFFEDQAPIGKNLYLSGIPKMTSMIHTECVRHLASERRMWKAENWLLRHKLENQQKALQDTREDSWQLKVENVALKSEITHLHMALAHAKQFIPQLHVDLPSPPFVPKSPSSLSSNTIIASSSIASIQSTIATIAHVASARLDTPSLNFDAFLANEDLSIIHLREALTAFHNR